MCGVAHDLVVARSLTEQAARSEAAGDEAAAQQQALQARTLAREAHDRLQTITSDAVTEGETWQALLKVYLHVGQALNALLPGFDPAMTDTELAAADRALETVAAGLPADCFKIGATVDGLGDVGLVSPVMTR